MDPLSDVLSLLRLRSFMFRSFELGGDWAIAFDSHRGMKCFALASGECWLLIDGESDPIRLRSGDCFLLPRGLAFRLASDQGHPASNAADMFRDFPEGKVAILHDEGDCSGMGGHFAFDGEHTDLLLACLPNIVHIRGESDRATLRWNIDRMMHELREPQPGGSLVAHQLASMILVQALRLHLAERPEGSAGWLFALVDRQMNAAISAIHRNPGHRWTLGSLSEVAAMSRSTFALRFKQATAVSPMDYLAKWRMLLASDRLLRSTASISTIALSLGYESESAFSTAFKRIMGCSPREYVRGRRSSQNDAEVVGATTLVARP